MKLEELIRSRRTVHTYSSEAVPDQIVRRALELALWAPNHKLTFPWRFFIVGPRARQVLADLSVELKEKKKAVSEIERQAIRNQFLQASHLVMVGMNWSEDPTTQWEDYAAVAAGLQNAQLYLWDNGIGSKWATGAVTHDPRTYELAGINPKQVKLVGFLWIGMAAKPPPVPDRPIPGEVIKPIP